MTYTILHYILLVLYATLPVAALVPALWPGSARRRNRMGASLLLSVSAAVALGLLMTYISAVQRLQLDFWPFVRLYSREIARTCYFIVGLLTLLKIFNGLLDYASQRLLRRYKNDAVLGAILFLGRGLLMMLIGLPFFCAALLCFRPKISSLGHPTSPFDRVSMTTTDHFKIAGWWIPTTLAHPGPHVTAAKFDQTVILIPGLGSSKARQLPLAHRLAALGYNILIIDLRGHGESEGHFTSFGDLERRDVLAAVRFAKTQHPAQSRRVYCVGVGIGADAGIAAATDADPAGAQIDAVVAIGGYADLSAVLDDAGSRFLDKPLSAFLTSLTLPVISAHAGADLSDFSPGTLAGALWPRPILVIHQADLLLPQAQSEALFRDTSPPHREIWLDTETQVGQQPRDVNDQLSAVIDAFLRHSQPTPVI